MFKRFFKSKIQKLVEQQIKTASLPAAAVKPASSPAAGLPPEMDGSYAFRTPSALPGGLDGTKKAIPERPAAPAQSSPGAGRSPNAGQLTASHTQRWQTVYVFISSTFNDMHAERDYLVKQVFPELREWCEQHRLHLVDIDLRWGVTEQDATQNKRVVQVCLDRIDQCRPFFLCFLGQRRGWVPALEDVSPETLAAFPSLNKHLGKLSVTELEILHALIEPLRQGEAYQPVKFAFFYARDGSYLTDLPQEPVQLREIYTDQDTNPSQNLLQQAGSGDNFQAKPYCARWDASAVTPELAFPLVCSSSQPANLDRWRKQWQSAGIPVQGDSILEQASLIAQATAFNRRLTAGRLGDFTTDGVPLKAAILQDLQQAIANQFPDHMRLPVDTVLQRELDEQEQFIQAAGAGFIPRAGDFENLDLYIHIPDQRLLVLAAPGGAGKSTLLANWLLRLRENPAGNQPAIFFRFIGNSQASGNVDSLLRSILEEASSLVPIPIQVPLEAQKLSETWAKLLSEALGKPCLVVLDALDQLDSSLSNLAWLPQMLPPNLKVIASFQRGRPESEALIRSLQETGLARILEVKPFDSLDDRRKLVQETLSQYLKELDAAQLEKLIQLPGAENPLYLKVLLSELRVFGVFSGLGEKIAAFGADPQRAFNGVLERLESDPAYSPLPPAQVAPLIFALLAASRHGLAVDELAALLVQEMSLDQAQLEAARQAVNLFLRQVRPFLARREGRYDFFYASFRSAALQRYAVPAGQAETLTQRSLADWHRALARFFQPETEQSFWLERSQKLPHVRKTAELPYHLAMSGQSEAFTTCLTNFEFIYAKLTASGCTELMQDYALASSLPLATAQAASLTALQKALRLSQRSLAHLPDLLAGQLIGRLQGTPGKEIAGLLKQAARWTEQPWLRPIQVPLKKPNSTLLNTLSVSSNRLIAFAACADGRRAVTLSQDLSAAHLSLKLWDVQTGKRLWLQHIPAGEKANRVILAPDEGSLFCICERNLLEFKLENGRLERTWGEFVPPMTRALVCPDGRVGFVLDQHGFVRLDLAEGSQQRLGGAFKNTHIAHAAKISADGKMLAYAQGYPRLNQPPNQPSGSRKPFKLAEYLTTNAQDAVFLQDTAGTKPPVLLCEGALVDDLAFSPDGNSLALVSELGRVELWDLRSKQRSNQIQGLTEAQAGSALQYLSYNSAGRSSIGREQGRVGFTPDGTQLVCAFTPGYLKTFDVRNPALPSELNAMYTPEPFTALQVISDRRAATTSVPNSLEIWDLEHGQLVIRLLAEGEDFIQGMAACTSGEQARMLTADQGNALRLWELTPFLTGAAGGQDFDRDAISPIYTLSLNSPADRLAMLLKMSVQVVEMGSFKSVQRLPAAPPPTSAMQFIPGTQDVILLGIEGTLKIWDANTAQCKKEYRLNAPPAQTGLPPGAPSLSYRCLAVTPDGRYAVCGDNANGLRRVDLLDGSSVAFGCPPLEMPVPDPSPGGMFGVPLNVPKGQAAVCVLPGNKTVLSVSQVPLNPDEVIYSESPAKSAHLGSLRTYLESYALQSGARLERTPATALGGKDATPEQISILDIQPAAGSTVIASMVQRVYGAYDKVTGWAEEILYALTLYNLEDHTARVLVRSKAPIRNFALLPGFDRALVVLEDSTLELVSLEQGAMLAAYRGDQNFNCCTISPDGLTACLGDQGGGLTYLCLENMPEV